ncbi:hypothetical protein D9M69_471190 [compost metagenome]
MAACQTTSMLGVPASSRASSLPQGSVCVDIYLPGNLPCATGYPLWPWARAWVLFTPQPSTNSKPKTWRRRPTCSPTPPSNTTKCSAPSPRNCRSTVSTANRACSARKTTKWCRPTTTLSIPVPCWTCAANPWCSTYRPCKVATTVSSWWTCAPTTSTTSALAPRVTRRGAT